MVSGNAYQGIHLFNGDNSIIQGNYVGTNAAGTTDINGTTSNSSQSGISLNAGTSGVLVGGTVTGAGNLISGNNWNGIEILDATTINNTIQGNLIGTDVTGLNALGNAASGVAFWGSGTGNVVGGNVAETHNVLSGNIGSGVFAGNFATGATVQGNYIGLGGDGSTIIGNGWAGLQITNGSTNTLIGSNGDGTSDANERNVISGNINGIIIQDAGTTGTMVYGNYIGTDATGLLDRGNGFDGIRVETGATNSYIGGSGTARRNIIAGNDQDGVQIADEASDGNFIQNNWIGLGSDGVTVLGNGASASS